MENYIEQKVALAVQYFKSGYNCSQSVFMAFADDFGVDKTMAAKISASFGGGIGRMREVCGTVCGMAMCAGFISPADDPSDKVARTANYALVQEFAEKFRAETATSSAAVCSVCQMTLVRVPNLRPAMPSSTRNVPVWSMLRLQQGWWRRR